MSGEVKGTGKKRTSSESHHDLVSKYVSIPSDLQLQQQPQAKAQRGLGQQHRPTSGRAQNELNVRCGLVDQGWQPRNPRSSVGLPRVQDRTRAGHPTCNELNVRYTSDAGAPDVARSDSRMQFKKGTCKNGDCKVNLEGLHPTPEVRHSDMGDRQRWCWESGTSCVNTVL